MASTYVNDLRLEEITTGEKDGTWGTLLNTQLELIGEALAYGTLSVAADSDETFTVADGATDAARSLYLKFTSGVSLTATRTLTIAPNTISRVMIIENATSGSQSIIIKQGSGAEVTILTASTAVLYLDGAGAGAAVVDTGIVTADEIGVSVQAYAAALDAVSGTNTGDQLAGNGLSGTTTLALDLNELSAGGTLEATDHLAAANSTVSNKQLISNIPLSIFNNDITSGTNTGDQTAGNGLSGTTTLALDVNGLSVGGTLEAGDHLIAANSTVSNKQLISSIPLSIFNNDLTMTGTYTEEAFTGDGTWTKPSTVGYIYYILVAGGGGGAGSVGSGGGGGGGGQVKRGWIAVTDDVTVTIGAGGAGGVAATDGSNGSNSTFTTGCAVTAYGGGGGKAAGAAANRANGSTGGSGGSEGGGGGGGAGGNGSAGGNPYVGGHSDDTGSGGGSVTGSSAQGGCGGIGIQGFGGGGGGGHGTPGFGKDGGGDGDWNSDGDAGTANTGGGGGGADTASSHNGGAGGSGYAIIYHWA